MTAIHVALHQQGVWQSSKTNELKLAITDLPKTLDELMNMCIRLDGYMQESLGVFGQSLLSGSGEA